MVAAELCRRASCPVGCDRTWAAGAGMFSTTGMLFSGPGAAFAAELVEVEASRSTGASVRSMAVASSVRAGLPGDGGAVSASRSTWTCDSTVTSSEGTSTGRRCPVRVWASPAGSSLPHGRVKPSRACTERRTRSPALISMDSASSSGTSPGGPELAEGSGKRAVEAPRRRFGAWVILTCR